MIKIVSARRGGAVYMGEYLQRMGDLWAGVLAPMVRRDGRVMVAGPAGVDGENLGNLTAQSGGFGVAGGVPEFLEERVWEYLSGDGSRFAVLELWTEKGPFSFPLFGFQPSLMATWEGRCGGTGRRGIVDLFRRWMGMRLCGRHWRTAVGDMGLFRYCHWRTVTRCGSGRTLRWDELT